MYLQKPILTLHGIEICAILVFVLVLRRKQNSKEMQQDDGLGME